MRPQLSLALAALALAAAAQAGDGRVEIDATRAAAGGITPGDAPGFPVTISLPGSYLLTSNLSVDGETTAIELVPGTDLDVTLDLGGFSILGPNECGFGGSCVPGSGIGVRSEDVGHFVRVVNGAVRGMGDAGIFIDGAAHIEEVTVSDNVGLGVRTGPRSLVLDSSMVANTAGNISAGSFSALLGNHSVGGSTGTSDGMFLGRACVVTRNVFGGHASGASSAGTSVLRENAFGSMESVAYFDSSGFGGVVAGNRIRAFPAADGVRVGPGAAILGNSFDLGTGAGIELLPFGPYAPGADPDAIGLSRNALDTTGTVFRNSAPGAVANYPGGILLEMDANACNGSTTCPICDDASLCP